MNKLLDKQIHELLAKRNARALTECEGALRAGAATLWRAAEITATTVVCESVDGEFDAVASVVVDIAHQYGLEASIRQQSGSCSVRFWRGS